MWIPNHNSSNYPTPTALQPLLSPFIPVPGYLQHLLMPAADPHRGDTLNGSLIRILVTLGHAAQTVILVTSSRTGFRALANSNCTKVMFLHMCHSVCPQGDVYPSMQWVGGVYPSMQWEICFRVQGVYITLGRHLPLADTPIPSADTPLSGPTSRDGH